jgi:hypothetical protein
MIAQAEVAHESIISKNFFLERSDARLIAKMRVALDEALVELDDLAERQVLTRRLVQPARGLANLQSRAQGCEQLPRAPVAIRTMRDS